MATNHTSASMTWMLLNRCRRLDYRRNTVVPNAYWGLGLTWEADLLVISKAGYLTEVEIKVSKADLLHPAPINKEAR